jgi:hypothetical protein
VDCCNNNFSHPVVLLGVVDHHRLKNLVEEGVHDVVSPDNYVLPLPEGDQLVGRIDPKFQRERGTLEVRQVYWEPNVKVTKARRKKLDEALARLANLIGAEKIEFPK